MSGSQTVRAHAIVKGLVQGVFYRSTAAETALSMGLEGWVKNLPNGDVELTAEGPKESVESLLEWCKHGPPSARVTNVAVQWEEPTGEFGSFSVTF